MCELRGDFLNEAERKRMSEFPTALRGAVGAVDTILTLRRETDGGHFTGSERNRRRLLEQALSGGFTYVDIEDELFAESPISTVIERAREAGTRLIRSRHDFSGTPEAIVPTMLRMGADGSIPKLAVTPRDSTDVLAIFHAYDALAGAPFVLLGMGQVGVPSRILCLAYGAAWTYASDSTGAAAAPGHTTPHELAEVYRATELNRETAIFGVVGNPVGHSRSPEFHNARFIADRRNAVYLPFEVDDFSSFLPLADYLAVQGLSVTLPHKGSAAELARQSAADSGAADAVVATGACNTLIRGNAGADGGGDGRADGRAGARPRREPPPWRGVNTDIPGFLEPLDRRFGGAPRRAAVIGAGGVARAVVYALLERGVEVVVVNRTASRAEALATAMRDHFHASTGRAVSVTAASLGEGATEIIRHHRELIVQTTNQGMIPNEERDPIEFYRFAGSETVYDLVYTPERTRLLRRAEAAGCAIISGKEMFVAQAEAQAALFAELLGPSA
jgi:3-dehydroquinate dehydratase/shikimate dehydrogenase